MSVSHGAQCSANNKNNNNQGTLTIINSNSIFPMNNIKKKKDSSNNININFDNNNNNLISQDNKNEEINSLWLNRNYPVKKNISIVKGTKLKENKNDSSYISNTTDLNNRLKVYNNSKNITTKFYENNINNNKHNLNTEKYNYNNEKEVISNNISNNTSNLYNIISENNDSNINQINHEFLRKYDPNKINANKTHFSNKAILNDNKDNNKNDSEDNYKNIDFNEIDFSKNSILNTESSQLINTNTSNLMKANQVQSKSILPGLPLSIQNKNGSKSTNKINININNTFAVTPNGFYNNINNPKSNLQLNDYISHINSKSPSKFIFSPDKKKNKTTFSFSVSKIQHANNKESNLLSHDEIKSQSISLDTSKLIAKKIRNDSSYSNSKNYNSEINKNKNRNLLSKIFGFSNNKSNNISNIKTINENKSSDLEINNKNTHIKKVNLKESSKSKTNEQKSKMNISNNLKSLIKLKKQDNRKNSNKCNTVNFSPKQEKSKIKIPSNNMNSNNLISSSNILDEKHKISALTNQYLAFTSSKIQNNLNKTIIASNIGNRMSNNNNKINPSNKRNLPRISTTMSNKNQDANLIKINNNTINNDFTNTYKNSLISKSKNDTLSSNVNKNHNNNNIYINTEENLLIDNKNDINEINTLVDNNKNDNNKIKALHSRFVGDYKIGQRYITRNLKAYDSLSEEEQEESKQSSEFKLYKQTKIENNNASFVIQKESKIYFLLHSINIILGIIFFVYALTFISYSPYYKNLFRTLDKSYFQYSDSLSNFSKQENEYLHYTSENKMLIALDLIFILNFIFELTISFDNKEGLGISLNNFKDLNFLFVDSFLTKLLIAFPFHSLYLILISKEHFSLMIINFPVLHNNLLHSNFVGLVSHFRVLKCFVLFRLNYSLEKILFVYDLSVLSHLVIKFLVYTFYIHFLTCFWLYLHFIQEFNHKSSWVFLFNFIESNEIELYITSLYFNLCTFFAVGYGDIYPKTILEIGYGLVLLILSCTTYSVMLAVISTKINGREADYSIYLKKKEIFQNITDEHTIPPLLKKKIFEYMNDSLLINYESRRFLIENLPIDIKNELLLKMYWESLDNIVFFENTTKDFSVFMLSLLKPYYLEKGEVFYQVGSFYQEMFFVIKGQIEFFFVGKNKGKKFFIVRKGENFGEINLLENETIEYEIRGSKFTETHILSLTKEDLELVKANYPELLKIRMRDSVENYHRMMTNKIKTFKIWAEKLKENINYNDDLQDSVNEEYDGYLLDNSNNYGEYNDDNNVDYINEDGEYSNIQNDNNDIIDRDISNNNINESSESDAGNSISIDYDMLKNKNDNLINSEYISVIDNSNNNLKEIEITGREHNNIIENPNKKSDKAINNKALSVDYSINLAQSNMELNRFNNLLSSNYQLMPDNAALLLNSNYLSDYIYHDIDIISEDDDENNFSKIVSHKQSKKSVLVFNNIKSINNTYINNIDINKCKENSYISTINKTSPNKSLLKIKTPNTNKYVRFSDDNNTDNLVVGRNRFNSQSKKSILVKPKSEKMLTISDKANHYENINALNHSNNISNSYADDNSNIIKRVKPKIDNSEGIQQYLIKLKNNIENKNVNINKLKIKSKENSDTKGFKTNYNTSNLVNHKNSKGLIKSNIDCNDIDLQKYNNEINKKNVKKDSYSSSVGKKKSKHIRNSYNYDINNNILLKSSNNNSNTGNLSDFSNKFNSSYHLNTKANIRKQSNFFNKCKDDSIKTDSYFNKNSNKHLETKNISSSAINRNISNMNQTSLGFFQPKNKINELHGLFKELKIINKARELNHQTDMLLNSISSFHRNTSISQSDLMGGSFGSKRNKISNNNIVVVERRPSKFFNTNNLNKINNEVSHNETNNANEVNPNEFSSQKNLSYKNSRNVFNNITKSSFNSELLLSKLDSNNNNNTLNNSLALKPKLTATFICTDNNNKNNSNKSYNKSLFMSGKSINSSNSFKNNNENEKSLFKINITKNSEFNNEKSNKRIVKGVGNESNCNNKSFRHSINSKHDDDGSYNLSSLETIVKTNKFSLNKLIVKNIYKIFKEDEQINNSIYKIENTDNNKNSSYLKFNKISYSYIKRQKIKSNIIKHKKESTNNVNNSKYNNKAVFLFLFKKKILFLEDKTSLISAFTKEHNLNLNLTYINHINPSKCFMDNNYNDTPVTNSYSNNFSDKEEFTYFKVLLKEIKEKNERKRKSTRQLKQEKLKTVKLYLNINRKQSNCHYNENDLNLNELTQYSNKLSLHYNNSNKMFNNSNKKLYSNILNKHTQKQLIGIKHTKKNNKKSSKNILSQNESDNNNTLKSGNLNNITIANINKATIPLNNIKINNTNNNENYKNPFFSSSNKLFLSEVSKTNSPSFSLTNKNGINKNIKQRRSFMYTNYNQNNLVNQLININNNLQSSPNSTINSNNIKNLNRKISNILNTPTYSVGSINHNYCNSDNEANLNSLIFMNKKSINNIKMNMMRNTNMTSFNHANSILNNRRLSFFKPSLQLNNILSSIGSIEKKNINNANIIVENKVEGFSITPISKY